MTNLIITNKKPRASIVLTTYNRLELLKERSLPSALNQIYENFEVIVVDDNSNDNTQEYMETIMASDERLKYIRHKTNKGASAARNTGVRQATGEFIVFLDDDNALKPNFLAETIPVLSNMSREYGALFVGRRLITKFGEKYSVPKISNDSFFTTIDDGWLMRREVCKEIPWDEDLYHDEDISLGISFFEKYKAGTLDQPLFLKFDIRKTKNHNYLSHGLSSEKRLKGLDNLVRKYLSKFKDRGTKKDKQFIYRFIGGNYVLCGKVKKGLNFLWQAFKIQPSVRNIFNVIAALGGKYIYTIYWHSEVFLSQLKSRLV